MAVTNIQAVIAQLDLPNPTIPVPFERFENLRDSDDILQRMAFWAFYSAWLNDKHGGATGGSVEARHDGHALIALYQQMALRDLVLIEQHDLYMLTEKERDSLTMHMAVLIMFVLSIVTFAFGMLFALWLSTGVPNG